MCSTYCPRIWPVPEVRESGIMVYSFVYFTFPVLQYMHGQGFVIGPAEWKEADFQVNP